MKLRVIDWHIPLVGGVATGHNLLQSLSLRCESLSDVIVLLISRRWGGDALGGAARQMHRGKWALVSYGHLPAAAQGRLR